MEGRCYRVEPDGATLHVRVTPNAGADRIDGAETRDNGSVVLRIRPTIQGDSHG